MTENENVQQPEEQASDNKQNNDSQQTDFNAEAEEEQVNAETKEVISEHISAEKETFEENELEEQLTETVDDIVVDEQVEPTVTSVIEAIVFAADEPLSINRIIRILQESEIDKLQTTEDDPLTPGRVRKIVKELNDKYRQIGCAFRIEQIAGGLQMMTLSVYNQWLTKLLRARGESKLSQSALETLAIIAYKQPVIRADVEAIRGVGAGEMIRSLMYKGLVKIAGRAEIIGRPLLYGTTKKFLETFGLNSLKDLPKVEELKQPK